MSTRRLVVERREDGTTRVVSVPLVQWEIYDQLPRQMSAQELQDEIGLLLADLNLGPQPEIVYGTDGDLHLQWPPDLREVEKLAEAVVTVLAPAIRRERRARRARRIGRTPAPKPKPSPTIFTGEREAATMRIPAKLIAAVAEHARAAHEAEHGHESLGCLILDHTGKVVQRYTRMRNAAHRPLRVRFASDRSLDRAELPIIVLHSHPLSDAKPSELDVPWVRRLGLDVFAIYSLPEDELRFWRVEGDAFTEAEFVLG
jgi:proteasome lid subunit RPN8/RPN11